MACKNERPPGERADRGVATEIPTKPIALTADLVQRFWRKVDQSGGPDACWPWTATKRNGGYGVLHIAGTKVGTVYAHRVSRFIATGRDPLGFLICHRCDNPWCVNPAHLFEGSVADNVADMLAKKRPTCLGKRQPHEAAKVLRGERIASAKLSADQVVTIRHLAGTGENSTTLGQRYGVDSSTVRQIVRREIWQHV